MTEKICPILTAGYYGEFRGDINSVVYCKKRDCELWSLNNNCCGLKVK